MHFKGVPTQSGRPFFIEKIRGSGCYVLVTVVVVMVVVIPISVAVPVAVAIPVVVVLEATAISVPIPCKVLSTIMMRRNPRAPPYGGRVQ